MKESLRLQTNHKVPKRIGCRSGFASFIVPDDVGGRFSVLTPVGLLPLAVAGIDIEQLLAGAKDAVDDFSSADIAPIEPMNMQPYVINFYLKDIILKF